MSRVPAILCIDDEVLGLEIRKVVLEREGYVVHTAADGPTGIHIFRQQTIDAVVLDFAMPGMNGGAVAVALREERRHYQSNTPFRDVAELAAPTPPSAAPAVQADVPAGQAAAAPPVVETSSVTGPAK